MKVRDNEQWTNENFGNVNLGDKRRTKRLKKIVRNMLAAPRTIDCPAEPGLERRQGCVPILR